jgi:DNA-binding MarR family transcriptional regulator
MSEVSLPPTAEQYVERMGLLWQAQGLPRTAGRIVGLLAMQGSALSIEDLASALRVSRGSISTDARRLERLGLVHRSSRPGDRRDFYAVAPDMPARVVALKLAELERFESVLEAACELPETPPAVRERLCGFADFHRRAVRQLQELLGDRDAAAAPNPNVPSPP